MSGKSKDDESQRDIRWIMKYLPHRYPFLLVDRVLEMEPRQSILAIKNVTINEEFFVGHFPGQPVVPGVLLLEGLAQAGGILALYDHPDRENKLLLFTGVDRARFRRPVVPGDQVHYQVEIIRLKPNACRLDARALVDGQLAAEAVLSSVMVDKPSDD